MRNTGVLAPTYRRRWVVIHMTVGSRRTPNGHVTGFLLGPAGPCRNGSFSDPPFFLANHIVIGDLALVRYQGTLLIFSIHILSLQHREAARFSSTLSTRRCPSVRFGSMKAYEAGRLYWDSAANPLNAANRVLRHIRSLRCQNEPHFRTCLQCIVVSNLRSSTHLAERDLRVFLGQGNTCFGSRLVALPYTLLQSVYTPQAVSRYCTR